MLPVIIFGGIFSGAFTANEAAVVACVFAFVVELFIHKSIKFRDVKRITVSSAVTSATLLIIVAGATCFGRYLTLENIPGQITEAVLSSIQSPIVFLAALNILLLIVGMFMDIISATLILGPVFLPMLGAFGIDPMHFGLIHDRKSCHRLLYAAHGGQPLYYGLHCKPGSGICLKGGDAVSGHTGRRADPDDLLAGAGFMAARKIRLFELMICFA
jgi:hypothetical protein